MCLQPHDKLLDKMLPAVNMITLAGSEVVMPAGLLSRMSLMCRKPHDKLSGKVSSDMKGTTFALRL